ncbi:MAG: hypothetical protein ACRCWM_11245 [Sarcina sp.]
MNLKFITKCLLTILSINIMSGSITLATENKVGTKREIPKYMEKNELYVTGAFQYKGKSLISHYDTKNLNEEGVGSNNLKVIEDNKVQKEFIEDKKNLYSIYDIGNPYSRGSIKSGITKDHEEELYINLESLEKTNEKAPWRKYEKYAAEIAGILNISKDEISFWSDQSDEGNWLEYNADKDRCGIYNHQTKDIYISDIYIDIIYKKKDNVLIKKENKYFWIEGQKYQEIHEMEGWEIQEISVNSRNDMAIIINNSYSGYIVELKKGKFTKIKKNEKERLFVKNWIEEDINGDYWILEKENNRAYISKYDNKKFIKYYEVDFSMETISVYDENNILATKWGEDGFYTIIDNENTSNLDTGVNYQTHIEDYGWQDWKSNGEMSGTSGEAKRLEGIKLQLKDKGNIGIAYRTHIQDIGWQDWKSNGEMAGTSGQSKRLEGIEIKLINTNEYDVEYRVHIEDIGWQDWKRNGEMAGTSGQSKRLEGIEVRLVKKNANIKYQTHIEDIGWQDWKSNGEMSGTSGQAKRLESIKIIGNNLPVSARVLYRTHIQDIGWQDWKSNGEISGTSGQSKRLEGIEIKLENAPGYKVEYRVHVEDIGWQDWKRNGEMAGTSGQAKRLEGIEIRIK